VRVYVDSNVFLYAMGGDHPYREPCRDLLRDMETEALSAETSAETLQEVVHHRLRRRDPQATGRARAVAIACAVVHPLDADVMSGALDLLDAHPRLWSRDAVHAATARVAGLSSIISADRDFDGVEGIVRVDPSDRDAIAALANE